MNIYLKRDAPMMWEILSGKFTRVPAQAIVAKYMLEIGIRVDGKRIFVDRVGISYSQLAKAVGKDKQIVSATIKTINSDRKLSRVFANLMPTCSLMRVAPEMGWEVYELTLSDPAIPGVLGAIATTIGETGVSIRQAIGEDPAYSTGVLYIVTETSLPARALKKIRSIKGVEKLTLH
jgi:hypothetical protein